MSVDIMRTIDSIELEQIESEFNVIESLIESYEKSIFILEQCSSDTDLSAFEIFQEGEKWDNFKNDANAPVLGNENENIGKRIAMFIPRLIAAIIRLCKNIFSKNKNMTRQMESDVAEMKGEKGFFSRFKKKKEPVEREKTSTEKLQEKSPTVSDDSGHIFKEINSILFGADESGNIDRIFIKAKTFSEQQKKMETIFANAEQTIDEHIEFITGYIKELKNTINDLRARVHSGGTPIRIRDDEFIAKMESFEKMNKGDIDACNNLINFIEGSVQTLNDNISNNSDSDEQRTKKVKLLKQYNKYLTLLNVYSTTIWEAWEHDRGARDQ